MNASIDSILKWVFTIIGGVAGLVAIKRYLDEHPIPIPKSWNRLFHPRKIGAIKKYLERELERLYLIRAPGSNLSMGDIIKDGGIFVDPLWTKHQDRNKKSDVVESPCTALVDYVVEGIEKGQKILLLGGTGQGKSTLMQRVFAVMANRYIENKSQTIPVYISCRQLALSGDGPIGLPDILAALQNEANPLPLKSRDITKTFKNEVALIFDGLDEIGGTIQQNIIHQRTDSDIFLLLPGVISCRMNFYQTYLSEIDNKLTRNINKVELCPLSNSLIKDYIKANCQITANQEMAESLIESIEKNRDLSDLSRRFISLVMMIDMFPNETFRPDQSWNITKLYDEYTRKYLMHEALKHKGLDWNQKSVIMERIAWEIHTTKLPSTLPYGENMSLTISRVELENLLVELIRRFDLTVSELLNDICYRAFLVNQGESFQFIHRSFQEFYVAKSIYRSITLEQPDAIRAIQEFIPVEIASYLKDMLVTSDSREIEKISDSLIRVYHSLNKEETPASLTALEHACYYLGTLRSDRIERFLQDAILKEKREWIRRGMIIDLIYTYKKHAILSAYLKELRQNPDVDTVNLGYHLEYYGDQAPQGDHTDKGGKKCDRTIRAIGRHLRDAKKHEVGWALDIYTLRRILETRSKLMPVNSIIPESELGTLKEFLNRSHALDEELAKEVQQLRRLFQKENLL